VEKRPFFKYVKTLKIDMLLDRFDIGGLYFRKQAENKEVLFDSWLRKTFKSANGIVCFSTIKLMHKKSGKNCRLFLIKFEKPEQHAHCLYCSYCCCSVSMLIVIALRITSLVMQHLNF
jgi:hypothetical protein